MTMTRCASFFLVATLMASLPSKAHEPVVRARTLIHFPDLPGYKTLKCDFHIHTVFSDGLVWPTVRSEEAWRQGLDAIAITDHIEYQPHKADVTTNRNRSYEIAHGLGSELDLIVIHGSEITRKMPPGHLNAIFITNSEALSVPEWRDAILAAHEQQGFIFWNHPNYPGGKGEIWYSEHTELFDQGLLQGIEVVNGRTYYPKAHRWAIEKNLTLLSNSDIHNALNLDYHVHGGDHRPATLVFAKARTAEAIREALLDRRTVVYSGDRLIGEERFLASLFEQSIRILNPDLQIRDQNRHYVQIHNDSDLDYVLERTVAVPELQTPAQITLPSHRTVLMEVKGGKDPAGGERTISLPYRVSNLLVGPDTPLDTTLTLRIAFIVSPSE